MTLLLAALPYAPSAMRRCAMAYRGFSSFAAASAAEMAAALPCQLPPPPALSSPYRDPPLAKSGRQQGQISWTRPSSCSHVASSSLSSSGRYSRICVPTLVPPVFATAGPKKVVVGVEARAGAAEQSWRNQWPSLNCALLGGSSFSRSTRHFKTERSRDMAAGGSKQGDGFALSSVLKETTVAEEAPSGTGNAVTLVTFETKDGQTAVGLLRGEVLWSLQEVLKSTDGKPLPKISDMASVIYNWNDLKDRLIVQGSGTNLKEVKLLAPIPRPTGVIMCIGKNYLDHVKEVDTWKQNPGISTPDAPKHPIVFTKAPQSVVGPGDAIKYPHGLSTAVDYEAELAVIIGKSGRNIKREDAMSYVFGYTIVNDVTARDLQKRHQQWFIGKSCDTFCPMGPGIVPASEIDGNNLQIQCWINDELRQNGRTSQMIFGIPQLIEVISAAITLQPGDIIATGTPSGVGSGFNPPRHLVPGDKIRIRIEGIGELSNTVE